MRGWLVVQLLVLLGFTGCAVPYAYPRVDKTEPIPVNGRDVTAFRVDYTAAGDEKWEREASEYRIALLPIDPQHSEIPEQSRVGLERGLYLYMFQLDRNNKVSEYVEVRLYRRGWRTLRLNNAYQGGPLKWEPAKTLLEREQAVDTLFSPHVAGTANIELEDNPAIHFDSNEIFRFKMTTTDAFRQACAFGAGEYAALGTDGVLSAPDRQRLEVKEAYLRKLTVAK